MNRWMLSAALILLPALVLGGCTTNAATGRSQARFLSHEEQIAIGAEMTPQLIQEYGGVVPDAQLRDYLTEIGRKLAVHVEEPYQDFPWEFTFLNSDVINAFALPGGKVFISRALVEKMTNEAQLAGVLGHEIGHVTAEHANEAMGRQAGLQIGGAIAGAIVGQSGSAIAMLATQVVVSGTGVFLLTYDRAQETEADELGMRYMTRAGYSPIGQLQLMEILKAASGGSSPPEFLSTHPLPQSRIDNINKKLQGKRWAAMVNSPDFVTNEAQFRSRCLDRLKRLPAPARSAWIEGLGDSVLWCAYCRAEATGMPRLARWGVVPQ